MEKFFFTNFKAKFCDVNALRAYNKQLFKTICSTNTL